MILLASSSEILEVTTSTTAVINYTAAFIDSTTSAYTPTTSQGVISSAATTTVISAPSGSNARSIVSITLFNAGTTSNTVVVKKDVSATEYIIAQASLLPGYSLDYNKETGWRVLDNSGRLVVTDAQNAGNTGITSAFLKIGTAPEAAGRWYSWAKDSGNPGAWAPGTPGLNGRATDGTTAADAGSLGIRNATGANYLTYFSASTSVACNPWLFDVLWVNSGLVVTTTTAQAIAAPVALPARDMNGTTNGEGVWAGILVTTATTNAGAITNTRLTYTNSDGVGSRTATMASFPATAVIGTVVWFQLQAGDKGVRSIQAVTLGTSYAAGAISIILAKPVWSQVCLVANLGGADAPPSNPGVRLYNGATVLPIGLMAASTATTISGSIQVMDR